MKRNAKTIARTINLSQLKSCEKTSPVKKMISADIADSCPGKTSYQTSKPVTIKICARKDLERTCPPKLCDCPPKGAPPSMKSIMGGWAKLLMKSAIAGGLVYWTSAEGLWGDSTQTEHLYYRMVETVGPVLPEIPDVDELKLPHLDSMKHAVTEAYNHFVCSAIGGLVEIPLAVKKKIFDAIFPCENVEKNSQVNPENVEKTILSKSDI